MTIPGTKKEPLPFFDTLRLGEERLRVLEIAIRAALAADPVFAFKGRPKAAAAALAFVERFPDAAAEPVYIHAQAEIGKGATYPAFASIKPAQRSAWEIFRATLLILLRADAAEAAKQMRKAQAPALGPAWMRGDPEDVAPGVSDRCNMGAPKSRARAPEPAVQAPASSRSSSAKRDSAKKKG